MSNKLKKTFKDTGSNCFQAQRASRRYESVYKVLDFAVRACPSLTVI